ncbi:biotin--[acetyl-CoA-carboxylase] ligase [Flavobacterium sp.]|uniref:biotin--[acetyl-CoA-carboxylase] ligase n=1 Tax=Flavobacterium sp. TaxID=239 RepID=UPI0039E54766
MRLVKLDAIDSTNDFLKSLSQQENVENFTVVSAENQTKGKGQMGAVWNSEAGKNLIMSMLVKEVLVDVHAIFRLNVIVALSVIEVLQKHVIPKPSVKWPNDIMSGNKKVGGILIENSIKTGGIQSIIGLGLNVNQTNFDHLPQASSLALVSEKVFDKEGLLVEIAEAIERNIPQISSKKLWGNYISNLFRIGIPTPFEKPAGEKFMAIIDGVEADGKIRLKLEDDSFETYGIKEIKMLF